MELKRIYHNYKLWEDYKNGFYNNCSKQEKQLKIEKVKEMFNDYKLTDFYMQKVINEWTYSCEHNLTNYSMNRVAYLGQAACCIYAKVPNLITMYAWKFLDYDVRERSDKLAVKKILQWEQKKKSELIFMSGKKRAITKEYQMKLLLN